MCVDAGTARAYAIAVNCRVGADTIAAIALAVTVLRRGSRNPVEPARRHAAGIADFIGKDGGDTPLDCGAIANDRSDDSVSTACLDRACFGNGRIPAAKSDSVV